MIGLFAALNELLIAPAIVTGLFYALLALVVGSAIIAIGGGIQPMRERWTNVLTKYDQEKPKIQEAAKGGKERIQTACRGTTRSSQGTDLRARKSNQYRT